MTPTELLQLIGYTLISLALLIIAGALVVVRRERMKDDEPAPAPKAVHPHTRAGHLEQADRLRTSGRAPAPKEATRVLFPPLNPRRVGDGEPGGRHRRDA